MLRDFLQLIFPRNCAVCENSLVYSEKVICTLCRYRFPKTNSHRGHGNPVTGLFPGRLPLEDGHAYYRFYKGNNVQRLIYRMKYRGEKEIGRLVGKWMGNELEQAAVFQDIDCIVPVPLHFSKKRKRGYNQCELFAKGLADALQVDVVANNLQRPRKAISQTNKHRFDRWLNVSSAFRVKKPGLFRGKHLLLVDDVVTTGATLEAAGQVLLAIPDTRLSVAAIAVTC